MSGNAQRAAVVGGGVVGTWHALELVRAGFTVDGLEASPTGAFSTSTSGSAITTPQEGPQPQAQA